MHLITVSNTNANINCRDSIGGSPFMPPGFTFPQCQVCSAEMALFLQLDIRPEFEIPFKPGSHLLIFMCPTHNEPPSLPALYNNSPLPESYWDSDKGHFSLLLFPPTELETLGRLDKYIEPYSLSFERKSEEIQDFGDFKSGSDALKVGGVPGWMNYSINKKCTCGGEMSFICQTPDGFGFTKTADAPEQPDSFSSTEYCLFLGNQVFILACNRQCNPRAVIAACDN